MPSRKPKRKASKKPSRPKARKPKRKAAPKRAKKSSPASPKRALVLGSMSLKVLSPDTANRSFYIAEGNNLVGRWDPEDGAFPEIDLEQVDPEAKISRKHCIIERRGNDVTIEDVGSLNGTFVNKTKQLKPGQIHKLKNGDELLLGRTLLRFETSGK